MNLEVKLERAPGYSSPGIINNTGKKCRFQVLFCKVFADRDGSRQVSWETGNISLLNWDLNPLCLQQCLVMKWQSHAWLSPTRRKHQMSLKRYKGFHSELPACLQDKLNTELLSYSPWSYFHDLRNNRSVSYAVAERKMGEILMILILMTSLPFIFMRQKFHSPTHHVVKLKEETVFSVNEM